MVLSFEAIDYRKDVDGFHPINVGRMSIGLPCFVSATPAGILELLKRNNIETRGKHCVVLGRSNIVGGGYYHRGPWRSGIPER